MAESTDEGAKKTRRPSTRKRKPAKPAESGADVGDATPADDPLADWPDSPADANPGMAKTPANIAALIIFIVLTLL